MKPAAMPAVALCGNQPPSGGCVLKQFLAVVKSPNLPQPPSGGCVLKPLTTTICVVRSDPAAFRRLCVETSKGLPFEVLGDPAAFRRLCVETSRITAFWPAVAPAAFRRLCVETSRAKSIGLMLPNQPPSGGCVLKPRPRAQLAARAAPAAFRRLCVETSNIGTVPQRRSPAAFRRLCVETRPAVWLK